MDSVAGSTGSRLSLLPPGERRRQLRQGRAAHPREDRAGPEDAQKVVLRPGMNVDATIFTTS